MKNKLLIICILIFIESASAQSKRRELIVSMYPFIPNADNFYRKLETKFENLNPDINLIIKLNESYYNDNTFINEVADIYEIDCIFLKDFIAKKKIQPIPTSVTLSNKDIFQAAQIVYQNNSLYGLPHWLCGNFIIYNKNDSLITRVKTLKDLEFAIGNDPTINNGIAMDLKGKLTLGELYTDGLLDQYQDIEHIKKIIRDTSNLDKSVITNLERLPKLTFSNWGRDSDYHDKKSFYQRQFARGNGRILIGYSESLYTILDEINNAYSKEENCFQQSNIAIKEFALSDNGSTPVGWVDALSLDAKLNGQKLKDAIAFLNFCTSTDGYHTALIPDYTDAPRYLLPAFKKYFEDKEVLKNAPLYTQLYPLAERIRSITDNQIFPALRVIGRKIDAEYFKDK